MPREREGVHHQREAEQVSFLAEVPDAVGAVPVQRVFEQPVDTLSVTTAGIQAIEVWVGVGDRAQVLRTDVSRHRADMCRDIVPRSARPWGC